MWGNCGGVSCVVTNATKMLDQPDRILCLMDVCAGNSGDREKALGIVVSSVCDREINSVADIQIGQSLLCLAFLPVVFTVSCLFYAVRGISSLCSVLFFHWKRATWEATAVIYVLQKRPLFRWYVGYILLDVKHTCFYRTINWKFQFGFLEHSGNLCLLTDAIAMSDYYH